MANGSRNGLMAGLRRSPTTPSLECDVGLGLKMQPTESSSYPCKRTMVMLPPPHQQAASGDAVFNGADEDGSCGGGPFFCNTSYQVASLSDIYDVAGVGGAAAAVSVLPRTWHPFTSLPDISTSFKSAGEGAPAFSKSVFTASQSQELERQKLICKCMMASVPVPPELLLPLPKNQFPGPVSQSSTSALEVRFSSGSDSEAWRCRRTDGKKWRCSRNVTPGQKYCERHAHKSRPRSRKPVEIETHNADATSNYSWQPNRFPINTTSNQPLRKPIAHLPATGSVASYDQTRGIEPFIKGGGGTIPFSACNQQWQHPMHSSSIMELSRHNLELNKEGCSFQVQRWDNLGRQEWETRYCNSHLDPKMALLPGNLNANTRQITKHFIDAWSTAENRGLDKVGKKECRVTSSMKLPFSSLTLSMPGGNEIDEDHERDDTSTRMMMGSERNSEEAMKAHWMNPVTWMDTTLGGPLGEALCLASSAKGASNLPSPHGYSNSTTTTSSCSQSSCEDGSQAHNFIG